MSDIDESKCLAPSTPDTSRTESRPDILRSGRLALILGDLAVKSLDELSSTTERALNKPWQVSYENGVRKIAVPMNIDVLLKKRVTSLLYTFRS